MKKLLIIPLLLLSIGIAIALPIILVGCNSVPDGYRRNKPNPIRTEFGENPTRFLLSNQFPTINISDGYAPVTQFFFYNDEVHSITANNLQSISYGGADISVLNHKGEEIGKFIDITRASTISYFVFLCGDYLYYDSIGTYRVRTRWRNFDGLPVYRRYFRYEYYRFNLLTGENENIPLALFWEKLSNVDNRGVNRLR